MLYFLGSIQIYGGEKTCSGDVLVSEIHLKMKDLCHGRYYYYSSSN